MARVKVTLNRPEVGLLLRTAFIVDVEAVARVLASHAGRAGHPRDMEIHRYVTDRYAVSVSVPGYRQAKYGALTKAAAAAGLTVRGTL